MSISYTTRSRLLATIAFAVTVAVAGAPSAAIDKMRVDDKEVTQIRGKLREIGLAMHLHHEVRNSFPVRSDRSNLSWRVHLLPFLDQGALYKRFRLDEPWDSQHNVELLPLMPEVFRSLSTDGPKTRFVTFAGAGTMFASDVPMSFRRVTDGASNTVLLLHAAVAVPWTKPEDLAFDATDPGRGLLAMNDRVEMVRADGGPLALPGNTPEETIVALATPRGGEVVDGLGLHRRGNPDLEDPTGPTPAMRIAAEKRESMNRLKQLALAAHNSHDARRLLPVPWERRGSRSGGSPVPPAVSWRVALLPYLDQRALFDRYDYNAEWNADPNRSILDKTPSVYRHPADLSNRETRLHVVVDNGALISTKEPNGRPTKFNMRRLRGGMSHSLLFIEAGPETASPWTQPTAIKHRPDAPVEALGTLPATGFPAAMMDGSVRWLTPDIDAEVFRAMVEGKPPE